MISSVNCQVIRCNNDEEWLAERAKDITSTEIAALFDCSPYITEFELWHQKKGSLAQSFNDNARILWGKRLQSSIGHGVAQDQGWEIMPADLMYFRTNNKKRIGASLDFIVQNKERGAGVLEVKNVDNFVFRNEWIAGDTAEAPTHIELQVQHQLEVTGLEWACIAALVGGNDLQLIYRERNPQIGALILAKVNQFWQSVKDNVPPSPIFDRDSEAVRELYKYAEPNKQVDLIQDNYLAELCRQYKDAGTQEKLNADRKKALGAEIIAKIGDAEMALANGFKISAGTVEGAPVSYFRKTYRGLRITELKQEESIS